MLFSSSGWQTFRLLHAGYNQWIGDVVVVCVSDEGGGFVGQRSLTLVCPFIHMSYSYWTSWKGEEQRIVL